MAIAHVPPNRVKEAYFILKSFKLKTKAENNFKKNILRYMNKQWLNNPNMPMSHWNLWRRNKNLTNNSHESFNGRLKDKIQKHNPNPYLLQKHLKAEMLNSRDKLQDFELCENPQRRYLKQERINKKRKMCKTRLKTDPQYNLEKYMFAMGNYCIKSSLGFGEPLNDSMVQSPKLLAKEKYKKKTSAPENMSSFESPKTDGSESDFSDVSYVLPNQTTNSTEIRKIEKIRKVCPVDGKGFTLRSKKLTCVICQMEFHEKCVKWQYSSSDTFSCESHKIEIAEFVLDVENQGKINQRHFKKKISDKSSKLWLILYLYLHTY